MAKKKKIEDVLERRYITFTPNVDPEHAEIRVVREEGEPIKIVGYFAKFNKRSSLLGGWFFEEIQPGFFRDAIPKSDTVDLFNHDSNYVLGRISSGTLRVWEDKIGLAYECVPPDTQIIRDLVLAPIERGDIKGCSFCFKIKRRGDDWDEDEEGRVIRTLLEGGCSELLDGSQVTFPAYPDTDVALRSHNEWKEKRNKQTIEDDRLKIEKEEEEQRKKERKQNEEIQSRNLNNVVRKRIILRDKEMIIKEDK